MEWKSWIPWAVWCGCAFTAAFGRDVVSLEIFGACLGQLCYLDAQARDPTMALSALFPVHTTNWLKFYSVTWIRILYWHTSIPKSFIPHASCAPWMEYEGEEAVVWGEAGIRVWARSTWDAVSFFCKLVEGLPVHWAQPFCRLLLIGWPSESLTSPLYGEGEVQCMSLAVLSPKCVTGKPYVTASPWMSLTPNVATDSGREKVTLLNGN